MMTYDQALKKAHKELQNKNGEEQVEYCKNKTGKDWNEIEDRYKYGTIIKKEIYTKEVDNDVSVQRSRIVEFSQPLSTYSEENVSLIISQYK